MQNTNLHANHPFTLLLPSSHLKETEGNKEEKERRAAY